jgi:hypothetical protein
MAKVFDEQGNIVDAGSDVILNDLTMAPILDAMPTDKPVYYAIVVPAADGKNRIALIMPKVIATVRMLQTNVDALGKRIDNIQLTPGPAGKDGINGLSGKDGATGSQGPQGITGPKGSDGQQGLTGPAGKDGANGATGATGAMGAVGPIGPIGATGPQGAVGPIGPTGATGATGAAGKDGVPTRVERYTTLSTDTNGVVTGTFSPAFTSIPDVDVVESWTTGTSPQQICGGVTSVSLTGFTAQIMLSVGTLVLNGSPFAKAGAGIKPIIRTIGR